MYKFLRYIVGYKTYKAPCKIKDRVLGTMLSGNIRYFYFSPQKDGGVVFSVTTGMERRMKKTLSECELIAHRSLLRSICIRKTRIGLLIGALLCVACITFCSMFVWEVKVFPSAQEDVDGVLAALADAGVSNGVYIPSIDKRLAENLVLLACPDLSYVSININGTLVSVNTDMRLTGANEKKDTSPADVRAREDGYIVRYETRKGTAVCAKGDTVSAGDILITGLTETKHHGVVPVRADGRVFALVRRSLRVEYPLDVSEKYYTGNEQKGVSMSFMFFDITLRKAGDYALQEVYFKTGNPEIVSGAPLPVTITETTHRQYGYREITLREDECIARARTLYHSELEKVLGDGELKDEIIKEGFCNGAYVIECEVWLVDDIAVQTPLKPDEK